MLKREQKMAVSYILEGKNIWGSSNWVWKKVQLYQSFVLAKEMDKRCLGSSAGRPSCLVIVPRRSIMEEQINSNDLILEVKGFSFSKDVLE